MFDLVEYKGYTILVTFFPRNAQGYRFCAEANNISKHYDEDKQSAINLVKNDIDNISSFDEVYSKKLFNDKNYEVK